MASAFHPEPGSGFALSNASPLSASPSPVASPSRPSKLAPALPADSPSRPSKLALDILPEVDNQDSLLPQQLERDDLRRRMGENLAALVFHLAPARSDMSEDDFVNVATRIERQAYQTVYKLFRNSDPKTISRQYIHWTSTLLVAEANKFISPHERGKAPMSKGGPSNSLSGSLKLGSDQLPTLDELMFTPVKAKSKTVHGWLEPGTRVLPYVLLRDQAVIIGRGKEAYESNSRIGTKTPSRAMAETSPPEGDFIEVPDGRVSRIHCVVQATNDSFYGPTELTIQDWSSNGTYVNGNKIGEKQRATLKEGDRVSLVLSVTPLVEQYFIFHKGDPSKHDAEGSEDWLSQALPITPSRRKNSLRRLKIQGSSRGLDSPAAIVKGKCIRTVTSRYNTKEWTTLDDLQCCLCLCVLNQCVALVPCGHNFCAGCLSQHFGSLLQSGMPLACPLRCAAPERVVANDPVRQLVGNHEPLETPHSMNTGGSSAHASTGGDIGARSELSSPAAVAPAGNKGTAASRAAGAAATLLAEEDDDDDVVEMSILCPLYDHMLPMEAASLKAKQVQVSLDQLRNPSEDPANQMAALEALARLSWSDDGIREEVAESQGIEAMVDTMLRHPTLDGIQCNGCLALMSLVRGEGDVCQSNQWRVAKAGGVEAIVIAMESFEDRAMVQLSALLCMIPLALENPMMQAHVAALALPAVSNAMLMHRNEGEVQAKAMVVLGVLAQGDDSVHDAIRFRELEAKAAVHIANCLQVYGGDNDEVLWAALFSLAVLVREGGEPFEPACRAALKVQLHKLVLSSLEGYQKHLEDSGSEVDPEEDTITKAGNYLLEVLGPMSEKIESENSYYRRAMIATAAVVAVPAVAFIGYRMTRS